MRLNSGSHRRESSQIPSELHLQFGVSIRCICTSELLQPNLRKVLSYTRQYSYDSERMYVRRGIK